MIFSQSIYLTHSSVAYISDSAELFAVIFFCLDGQWSGTLNMMKNTDNKRYLNSYSSLDMHGFGLDWSWGLQLTSTNGVIFLGLTG